MAFRPRLYFFVGYPGAGKTTAANIIHDLTGAVHLWADRERQKLFPEPTHSKSESDRLYSLLNRRVVRLLRQGKSVIFDTNFNHKTDRDLMRKLAQENRAEAKLIWITTPKTIAKNRAIHKSHRDRNGYRWTMSEAQFNSLSSKLEPIEDYEQPIKIDGSDIRVEELKTKLGI